MDALMLATVAAFLATISLLGDRLSRGGPWFIDTVWRGCRRSSYDTRHLSRRPFLN
jgi:hypothetical protein